MKYAILGFILILLCYLLLKNQENFSEYGTYKSTPFGTNSLAIIDSKDSGVLKNVRPELGANTYSYDLNYNEMNILLSKLVGKETSFSPKEDIIKNLAKAIVKEINFHFDKLELNGEFHPDDERKYKMIDYKVLKDEKLSKITNRVIMDVRFYKDMKDISYNVQFYVLYGRETESFYIKQFDIIGIDLNDGHKIKNIQTNPKNCVLNKNPGSILEKCHEEVIFEKEEMTKYFKNLIDGDEQELSKKEKKFLKDKKKEEQRHKNYLKYKCIGNEGFNESTCNSYSFRSGRKGTWDKPCTVDQECPFYKKNTNYPNERGGCKQGFCEMPLNIKLKGYKKYDKKDKPFCHNCKRDGCLGEECFTCCEEQETPDYMFENDTLERSNFF